MELAKAEDLSCAVLDVKLDDELIFEAAAEMLERKGRPIVFYTGQVNPEAIKREFPQAAVVMKPASTSKLLKTVVKTCGHG